MSVHVVPVGNGKESEELVTYKNNLGSCPTPQSRYIRVTEDQIQVVDKTEYCGVQTASLNNYYGHDDVRAVFLDKAPWNWTWFGLTLVYLGVGIWGLSSEDADNKQTHNIIGIVALVLFLIYLARFLYQFFRPKVNSSTATTRWKECPCSWGGQDEALAFIGRGPGVDIKSPDDIGVGILSKMKEEYVISEHWGRKEKGVSIRVILTNQRISIRRSKLCCCNKIITQDALETWKLEDVSSVTAEQSFPLWWILATIWAVLVLVVYLIRDGDEELKNDKDFEQVMIILYISAGLFFLMASKMTGGVGYCRKAFVSVYFKTPMWRPCFFLGYRTDIELPPGAAQGTADGIAKAIIAAKDAKAAREISNKVV